MEVRYGDRTLDNTDLSWASAFGCSPEALRQNLWQLTDDAYKGPLMGYPRKLLATEP